MKRSVLFVAVLTSSVLTGLGARAGVQAESALDREGRPGTKFTKVFWNFRPSPLILLAMNMIVLAGFSLNANHWYTPSGADPYALIFLLGAGMALLSAAVYLLLKDPRANPVYFLHKKAAP